MDRQRVIVGVDGSLTAFGALDAAALEAERRRTGLEVVHCPADPDTAGPVLRAAAARVRGRHPCLRVTLSAVVGDPAEALLVRGGDAVLTVVGSRRPAGLAGLLAPSVGRRVAARARGPVLVVPGADVRHTAGRTAPGGVLLGLESDGDADAALFAFEEARLRDTRLDVLHAWTYPPVTALVLPAGRLPGRVACQGAARSALPGRAAAPLREAGPRRPAESRPVRSAPCRELIEATGEADLMVVAVRPGGTGRGARPGPLVRALLRRSHCPVAVVPVGGARGG
ncbi:universal stress protein [Actinacidiphila sp. ITFR-21]|uniref:universal stress protein n=1 Tax=Actinacidiphila sp. ITFR-21 TaxID=3075199 RepID=UPI00288BFD46|nr:universal stress protein [Streptomyces sp. ITFR-21]WNI19446.1 universal stress protein [Streptomyces sp. ITFR-21]